MACEHAHSTTLLWLYGEADDAHLGHIQGCAECQTVVGEHADVASALGPTLSAVRAAPRGRPRWAAAAGALALAAAAVLTVAVLPPPSSGESGAQVAESERVEIGAAIVAIDPLGPVDSFDSQLDALDLELDSLSDDLEML